MEDSKDSGPISFDDLTAPQFLHAARKAVNNAKDDFVKGRQTLTALLDWVEYNPIRFGPDSAMGRLVDLIMKFDDDDDVDNNDIISFVKIIGEFFKNVTAKDIKETENWEMKTNMSANLLALFGRQGAAQKDHNSDWSAPTKAGMSNSAAVRPTEKNTYKEEMQAVAKANDNAVSESKHEAEAKAEKMDEDEEEEEEDDDDDDDDGNYDYEEDEDEEARPAIKMSLNLMRALGLDTTGMEEEEMSDWKPPERTGIEANPDSYKMGDQ
jgi:hypothetical protein